MVRASVLLLFCHTAPITSVLKLPVITVT